jgi:hypothetical protein
MFYCISQNLSYIQALKQMSTRKIQLNLLNEELKGNPWKVLGFIGAFLLNFNIEIWTFELTAEQMQRVFCDWERINHFE